MLGGVGVRGTLPGAGGEVGFSGAIGTEGDGYRAKVSAYAEAFVAGGLSLGRGPWGGLWSGDVSGLANATEIGVDTPFGSVSVLFDMDNMDFGLTVGGPSLGAGAFAKVKPLHGQKSATIFDTSNK